MGTILELRDITKKYGDFCANDKVSISVEEGSVFSLLGENGAGKSTLMNVLYGITQPTSGEIVLDGKAVRIRSPKDAIRLGIGMVHQHFMQVSTLTVAENIQLTDEGGGLFIDTKKITKRVQDICKKYHFDIDPSARISELTVGQQQKVEIVKAIYHDCRLLILDEPTAVLTPQETEELYTIIDQFRKENKSVIFISHKLKEVMHVSDEIAVLRAGKNVCTVKRGEASEEELAALMVGKKVSFQVEKPEVEPGETVLKVQDLRVLGTRGDLRVDGLSLSVRAGEIYGIAGVDGNGQTELVRAITGLTRAESGSIEICGQEMTNHSSGEVLACGVSHIPEDRQHTGILMDRSLMANLTLYDFRNPAYRKGRFLDRKKQAEHAGSLIREYDIKATSDQLDIAYLSGGNQQKAVVARELDKAPKLLLAVNPTRGVDIGAIEFIHKKIVEARTKGCAVLLVSTELDEIMKLSDRIGVIFDGKIIGEMAGRRATVTEIGMYMTGMQADERAGA